MFSKVDLVEDPEDFTREKELGPTLCNWTPIPSENASRVEKEG